MRLTFYNTWSISNIQLWIFLYLAKWASQSYHIDLTSSFKMQTYEVKRFQKLWWRILLHIDIYITKHKGGRLIEIHFHKSCSNSIQGLRYNFSLSKFHHNLLTQLHHCYQYEILESYCTIFSNSKPYGHLRLIHLIHSNSDQTVLRYFFSNAKFLFLPKFRVVFYVFPPPCLLWLLLYFWNGIFIKN